MDDVTWLEWKRISSCPEVWEADYLGGKLVRVDGAVVFCAPALVVAQQRETRLRKHLEKMLWISEPGRASAEDLDKQRVASYAMLRELFGP